MTSFVSIVIILHIIPLVTFLDLEFRDEQQQTNNSDELDDHLKNDQLEKYLGKGEGVQLERERPREVDGRKGELHRLGYAVRRSISWNEKSKRTKNILYPFQRENDTPSLIRYLVSHLAVAGAASNHLRLSRTPRKKNNRWKMEEARR